MCVKGHKVYIKGESKLARIIVRAACKDTSYHNDNDDGTSPHTKHPKHPKHPNDEERPPPHRFSHKYYGIHTLMIIKKLLLFSCSTVVLWNCGIVVL